MSDTFITVIYHGMSLTVLYFTTVVPVLDYDCCCILQL